MNIGAAQIDITPPVGTDLTGYAVRIQPSDGVLDPLYARAIHLDDGGGGAGGGRLLWIAADVIAWDPRIVSATRDFAQRALGLRPDQVLLSATHTHAGPATADLVGLGRRDERYLSQLQQKLQEVATAATGKLEPADFVFLQRPLDLAIDRRRKPSAHTDPVVTALAWRRPEDGTFVATLLNYAMHPVALGGKNRKISGDWCGYAAEAMRSALPGEPIALVTTGAAGNLNPPAEGLSPDEVRALGTRVAAAVWDALRDAPPVPDATLTTAAEIVPVPLDVMPVGQIDAHVNDLHARRRSEWDRPMTEALTAWRAMARRIAEHGPDHAPIELQLLRIGPVRAVAVNGEMFSQFTQRLRDALAGAPVFVVAYANDVFGYIPHAQAYDEGGYEVDVAHYFYNSFRPKRGGLELLAEHAIALARESKPS